MTDHGARQPDGAPPARAAAVRVSWGRLDATAWLRLGLVALLYVMLFRHALVRMVVQWATDASWSHGFLIPLFSLYLVHYRRDALLVIPARPALGGLLVLVGAILVYGLNMASPAGYAYLGSLAVWGALGGVVWFLGGTRRLRWSWLPLVYLLFAIPLPRRLYVSLTLPLRRVAAFVAAALLDLGHEVTTSVQGVVIDVVYQGHHLDPALNVAEACSGMRLLMAFLALGVAVAALHEGSLGRRLVLLVATVPIAVACNIVRVTATGFLYVFVHPRYTQGVYHDALGLAMLPLAFALHGALAWFLTHLFETPVRAESESDVVRRRGEPAPGGAG